MIRYQLAERAQLPQMEQLWSAVFGDGAEYIQRFYAHWFQRDCCFAASDGDTVAGMLHLLPCTLLTAGSPQRCRYLYACAVLPAYRRRGIFAALMERAIQICAAEHSSLVCIPANEGLFSYYARFGLSRVPCCGTASVQVHPVTEPYSIRALTAEGYAAAAADRSHQISCCVQWDRDGAAYAIEEAKGCGGFAQEITLRGGKAAAIGYAFDGVLHITDLAAPVPLRDRALQALAQSFSCGEILCSVPAEQADRIRYGALRTEAAAEIRSCYFPLDLLGYVTF